MNNEIHHFILNLKLGIVKRIFNFRINTVFEFLKGLTLIIHFKVIVNANFCWSIQLLCLLLRLFVRVPPFCRITKMKEKWNLHIRIKAKVLYFTPNKYFLIKKYSYLGNIDLLFVNHSNQDQDNQSEKANSDPSCYLQIVIINC